MKVLLLHESYADLIDSATNNIYPFRPGMSAAVDILTDTRENVISVPISAVTTRVKKKTGGTEEVKEEVKETKEKIKKTETKRKNNSKKESKK